MKGYDFIDDKEKMRDFRELSKEDFLASYYYLDEEDYDATINKRIEQLKNDVKKLREENGKLGHQMEGIRHHIKGNNTLIIIKQDEAIKLAEEIT